MRNASPLEKTIKALKINGVPALVKSARERINAHNCAGRLGYKLITRRRINSAGFEIHRVK